jgi:hypothetical protein
MNEASLLQSSTADKTAAARVLHELRTKMTILMKPSRGFVIRVSVFVIFHLWLSLTFVAVTQILAQDSQNQARIVPLFREARRAEQRRDFVEAARLYDKILSLDPGIAEVWTNKGLCLHGRQGIVPSNKTSRLSAPPAPLKRPMLVNERRECESERSCEVCRDVLGRFRCRDFSSCLPELAGDVRYSHGRIAVLGRAGLEATACECWQGMVT